MWLLHFLPDSFLQFVVHAVLLAGVLGTLLFYFIIGKFPIPFLGGYIRLGKILSVILLVSGLYFEGGYSNEMQWRERVREMEAKVAKAEDEARNANEALAKKSKERVEIIKYREIVVKQYIDKEVGKYNEKFSKNGMCAFPQEFVKAHNDSAEKPRNK